MASAVTDAAAIAEASARLRDRIERAGADPSAVTVVAVTKGLGAEVAQAAADAGLTDLGENYAQELHAKAAALAGAVRWHFIGRLQRNKVALLAPTVYLWQSVDRPALVDELATRAPGARVLVQVNISGEPQKGGCAPAEAPTLVARARDAGLDALGLMAVGPTGPAEAARAGFRALRHLADELALPVRSMGMSDDLDVAVEEGSTMVRVGRALLGPRPGTPRVRR